MENRQKITFPAISKGLTGLPRSRSWKKDRKKDWKKSKKAGKPCWKKGRELPPVGKWGKNAKFALFWT